MYAASCFMGFAGSALRCGHKRNDAAHGMMLLEHIGERLRRVIGLSTLDIQTNTIHNKPKLADAIIGKQGKCSLTDGKWIPPTVQHWERSASRELRLEIKRTKFDGGR